MKWKVRLLGAHDRIYDYDVETGWCEPLTSVQKMRERNEAVKRARQLHRVATGKPGIYSDMEPIGWSESNPPPR